MLGVDLNDGHLACCVLDASGNPIGEPLSIDVVTAGLRASRRDGRVRRAITHLLDHAEHRNCAAIVMENLDFADARATGRETLGRGKRGKRLRRTVAGIPTARFRTRLIGMAARRGIAVIGVDAAYTSRWAVSTGVNPCSNRLPNRSPGIMPRRPRSGDVASVWPSGVGRQDPAPDSGPPRALHRPGPITSRTPHHDGAAVPAHRHAHLESRRAGPPDNTHRQRPTPFGLHRTHSCSLIRNGSCR